MRRDIAIIAGITVLVVVLVLALGPHLSSVQKGTPERANSVGISPAEVPWSPSEAEGSSPAIPTDLEGKGFVRVAPVDSVTGHVVSNARCFLSSPYGDNFIDGSVKWLAETGQIEARVRPGKYRVRLVCVDHALWRSDPVDVIAGQCTDLGQVSLVPVVPVTFNPRAGSWPRGEISLVRIWPLPEPWEDSRIDARMAVNVPLQPGQYIGQVRRRLADPYTFVLEGQQAPEYGYDPTMRFDVGVDTREMEIALENEGGTLELEVRVRNQQGQIPRPAWVWAESIDPLFGTQIVAAAKSNHAGVATLRRLKPGMFKLHAGRSALASDTPGAQLSGVELSNAGHEPVDMVVREYAWDGEETLQTRGRLELTVLKHGAPVEGARLLRESRPLYERGRGGWYGPTSGADGRIVIPDTPVCEEWFELNYPTCRHFRFDVLPGETTVGEIELCPEGTAVVHGNLDSVDKKLIWAFLHTQGDDAVNIQLRSSSEGEFTVWDVPVGNHLVSITYDDYEDFELPLEVLSPGEVTWSISLAAQDVTVELPDKIRNNGEYEVELLFGEHLEYRDVRYRDSDWTETQMKLLDVLPGIYRVEFRSRTVIWRSEVFTVTGAPVTVSQWVRLTPKDWFRKEDERPAPTRHIRIEPVIPVGAVAPWLNNLKVEYRTDLMAGDYLDKWVRAGDYSSTLDFELEISPESQWLDMRIAGCSSIRVDLTSTKFSRQSKYDPEILAIEPKLGAPSRLILLDLPPPDQFATESLWRLRYRYDDRAWAGVDLLPDAAIRDRSRLIMRNGLPSLWLSELPTGVTTLELQLAGFETTAVDLQPAIAGYRELTCKPKQKN
ncbi:MAG: hypothetical protein KDB90_08550 [Planctomycetes bacterium]|nr:hypothetical protein [Planctomycetota bacterium]